jgi:hypothetical protein
MGGESPMQWDHRNCILSIPQQGRDQSQASLHGIDQSQASIRAFNSLIRQGPIVGQLTWHRLITGQLTWHRPITGQHTYLQFPYEAGTDPLSVYITSLSTCTLSESLNHWKAHTALTNHRPAYRLSTPQVICQPQSSFLSMDRYQLIHFWFRSKKRHMQSQANVSWH